MDDYTNDIRNAINKLGLREAEFSKCDTVESAKLASIAKERFVIGNPRVWWLGFSPPYQSHSYDKPDEWKARLNAAIPEGTKKCWLIGEPDSDTTPYTVYVTDTSKVAEVLSQCRFFEYYLVDPNLNWIIADTDHNQLIVAQPIAPRTS
jgi:hypothetical protein